MRRTWRGSLARVQFYFQEGNQVLIQFKQVLYVCAALKLLEVPWWVVVAAAPIVYVAHVLAGYGWIRWGWYRQVQEAPTVEAVNPVLMWQTHMLVRLYRRLEIPLDGMDVGEMPGELKKVLTSFLKEPHGEAA